MVKQVQLCGGEAYSKLANLDIVDTSNFLLLRDAQLQGRDESAEEVKAGEDEASSRERVRATADAIGQLMGDLDPVVV